MMMGERKNTAVYPRGHTKQQQLGEICGAWFTLCMLFKMRVRGNASFIECLLNLISPKPQKSATKETFNRFLFQRRGTMIHTLVLYLCIHIFLAAYATRPVKSLNNQHMIVVTNIQTHLAFMTWHLQPDLTRSLSQMFQLNRRSALSQSPSGSNPSNKSSTPNVMTVGGGRTNPTLIP